MDNEQDFSLTVNVVLTELKRATKKFGAFNSPHEGISIIREEYMELEHEVYWGENSDFMAAEAIQLAAMALRFLHDCCGCPDAMLKEAEDV